MNEYVQKAEIIAKVRIIKRASETDDPYPKAFFKAKVLELYKGSMGKSTIIVQQLGNSKASFDGNPEFQPGDRYILLLGKHTDKENTYGIYGADTHTYQFFEISNKTYIVKLSLEDPGLKDIEDKTGIREQIKNILKKRSGMPEYQPEPWVFTEEDYIEKLRELNRLDE